jgi:HAD superfamily hydrolase (TIGR01450 family)
VPLADEYDGFLIDLDGVVWIGSDLIPGAAETLRELAERGTDFVFVTNNPGRPRAFYAERLREAGIEVGEDRIVTAGESTARLAAEIAGPGGSAFVIGADAFHESVASEGLEVVDGDAAREADIVVVSGHREFDYEELLTATLALQRGARLVATSRDPTLPMPGGPWPGTGAVLAAVETASGASAGIGGKPEHHLFDLARERLGEPGRVAMVGDRVASDIEGGRRAGLDTVLVLSGATEGDDPAGAAAADHVIDDLTGLLSPPPSGDVLVPSDR